VRYRGCTSSAANRLSLYTADRAIGKFDAKYKQFEIHSLAGGSSPPSSLALLALLSLFELLLLAVPRKVGLMATSAPSRMVHAPTYCDELWQKRKKQTFK